MTDVNEPCDYLIIDDNEAFASTLSRSLIKRGLSVATAFDDKQALRNCVDLKPGRIILDLKLGDASGLHLISDLLSLSPQSQIVLLTGYSSIPTTVEAIKLGATNYLCKPASVEEILEAFESSDGNPAVDIPETPPSVDRLEWEHIQKVLADNDGNISATSRALGMHRRTLQRKLQKKPVKK